MSNTEYFEIIKSLKQNGEYKGKKLKFLQIMTGELTGCIGSGRRCNINIAHDSHKNLVIKNIRVSNQNLIDEIELNTQGIKIDKLYNKTDGTMDVVRHILNINDSSILPFGCTSNGNYLPVLDYSTRLIVLLKTFEEDPNIDYQQLFQVTYELYEIENSNKSDILKFVTPHVQYTGSESCHSQHSKIRLCYENIITHLIISITNQENNDLEKITLLLLNGLETIILQPVIEKFNNFYIIPFTKSLNFKDLALYGINFSKNFNNQINISLKNDYNPKTTIENYLAGIWYDIYALGQQEYTIFNQKIIVN